jgi:3',5'-cyclic AMP phosphodiesterase CpdA
MTVQLSHSSCYLLILIFTNVWKNKNNLLTQLDYNKRNGLIGRDCTLSGHNDNHPVELVFPVISDIHIKRSGNQDLKKLCDALDQLNRMAPHQDALAVVGDLTHFGTLKEYNRFFDLFNHKKQPQAEAMFAMGNHEYLNCLPSRIAQSRFLKMTGLPSIYYHRVIKGYHFIVLSPENRTKHGYYSLEQILWLSERLKQATHRKG